MLTEYSKYIFCELVLTKKVIEAHFHSFFFLDYKICLLP